MIDRDFIELQEALAGDYSLERELGRGGMGVVYLAREVQLDRYVAVKVLPQSLAIQPEVRERFLREARLAASLSHPHIVPIHRVGESRGFVFFAMGYVRGETLGERLRTRGPLPPSSATRLLREVAWALSYAHSHGIVHRDIKPDNILIEAESGRALVTDFGIAQGLTEAAGASMGEVTGTAHYMSPEQARGEPIDGRSDFYSLGVVGYLALSGRLPFDAPTLSTLLIKQQNEDPTPLGPLAPSAQGALVRAIERCLRRRAEDRFPSGEALAEALDAASNVAARTKIPVALRVWAQGKDPLDPVYVVWSGMFTLGFLSDLFGNGRVGVSDLLWIVAFGALPVVPMALFHARKTYQVLSAGYTLRDLRVALANWRQERREELAFEFEETETRAAKLLRLTTLGFLTSIGVCAAVGVPHTLLGKLLLGGSIGGSVLALLASNVLGVRLLGKDMRLRQTAGLRSKIWNSRLGDWAAKLLTPRKAKHSADLAYRPTEMALGVAAIDLYKALPRAYRDDIPELPSIVERLEAHAAHARARIEELDAMVANAGRPSNLPSNLAAAREAAKTELAQAVATLEALRLDLLRLHGGNQDLQPITTVLRSARELGEQLDRLVRADREVNGAQTPLALDLSFHTPT
jgi:serine/threonine-protein kinase